MSPCGKSANGFHEFEDFDFEAVCQFHNVEQAYVAFAALDAAHVIPVQVSQFRELLLREPSSQPKLTNALSEDGSRVGPFHPAIFEGRLR